jgi:hypothetical protein
MEMTWVKIIELPFVPFLGLEIIENGKFIVELKKFNEDGHEKTLTYDISTREFSYWTDNIKFNAPDNRDGEYVNKEQLIKSLISQGFKSKWDNFKE